MIILLLFLLFTIPTQPASASESDAVFVPYGFIKASYWWANHSVASLSSLNSNFSAPVASGPDRGSSDYLNTRNRSAIEVQQSRLGFQILPKSEVSGKLELDFFNAANSIPTTAANPRLRIAKIEWRTKYNTTLFAGQDWDIFNGNVNPYTQNGVGNYFQGGNVGYFRQQMGAVTRLNKLEYAAAIGMGQVSTASNNDSAGFANLPSLSLRTTYIDGDSKFGIAGIFVNQIAGSQPSDSANSHQAFGLAAFTDTALEKLISLHAKVYWGQNLRDIGSYGLSAINAASLHEWGGFLTVHDQWAEQWAAYGGVGLAQVIEKNLALLSDTSLVRNWQINLGAEYCIPESHAKIFLEGTRYASLYNLASGRSEFKSIAIESGFVLPF